MKRLGMIAAMLATVVAGIAGAQVKELTAPVCASPPAIDAVLTDAAWAGAAKYTGFLDAESGRSAVVQTTIWLCRDDAWLYVAARCNEPTAIGMKRIGTVRDAGSGDDCLEVFLDPGYAGAQYAHLTLTANNVQRDQWCRGAERNVSWDIPWRSAAQVDTHLDTATGWSAEMAIPLCVLRDNAGKGPWTMNVCRSRYAVTPAEYSSLSPVSAKKSFHDPAIFLPLAGLTDFPVRRVFAPLLGTAVASPFSVRDGKYSYGLAVTLRNRTGAAGRAELVVRDLPRDAAAAETVVAVDLEGRQEKTVAVRVAVAAPGPREARVVLREAGTGLLFSEAPVVGMDRLLPLDAYLDRNYYTSEAGAKVCAEILLDRAARESAKLEIEATLTVAGGRPRTARRAATGSVVMLELPLTGLAAGTYPVLVRAKTAAGQELGALTLELVKLPPAPAGINEVKVDRYNRCLLVDGAPFLPVGATGEWWPADLAGPIEEFLRADLARCKEAGFNTYMEAGGWTTGAKDPLADKKKLYDLVRANGMYIIPMVYKTTAPLASLMYSNPNFKTEARKVFASLDPALELTRAYPGVLAYHHLDEPQPGLKIDDVLAEFRDKVRSRDPYRPVYMSLTRCVHESQMGFPDRVTDLLGAHNYWYVMQEPSCLAAMSGYWGVLDAYSRKMHLPTMTIPQLDMWCDGFMTLAEQRAQTYLLLVHGSRSVIYFGLPWRHEKSVAMQKEISAEIRELTPALLTREPAQEVTWTPETACFTFGLGAVGQRGKAEDPKYPLVRVSLRTDPRGGQVLLAVNPNRAEISVAYKLSCLGPGARVESAVGPKKSYAVKGGGFADTLEPMGTRAYRIRGAAAPGDDPVRISLALSGPGLAAVAAPAPAKPVLGKNRMPNSSFERARMEDWPDGWSSGTSWIDITPSPKACGLDSANPYHGKTCLRVAKDGRFDTYVVSPGADTPPGKTYILSAWMRADKPGVTVRIYWGGTFGEFVLTDQWKRYFFTATPEPQRATYLSIWPWSRQDYAVYVDAVQIEEGSIATEYEPT